MTQNYCPCANVNSDEPCPEAGGMLCTGCKLVAKPKYCSVPCQFADWDYHKQYCKLLLGKKGWVPRWFTQHRVPEFTRSGYTAPFPTHKNIWGEVPALDVLKLDQNEGSHYDQDLALLFAASGDLRNVVKTVVGIPKTFNKAVNITINDKDMDIVARNIILLMVALTTFIRRSDLEFLYAEVRPMLEEVCISLEDEPLEHVHSKTFAFGPSRLNIVLPKKSWLALLNYLKLPVDLTAERAREARTAVTLPDEHKDYKEQSYLALSPSQRLCAERFRSDGILLPFGASRKAFDTPNPTLFHGAHWPYKDDIEPIHGWSLVEVMETSSGAAPSDQYGKLFYHLRKLFADFCEGLKERNISFRLYEQDIHILAKSLETQAYARIEVSNLLEEPGLDPDLISKRLVPLLQGQTKNPHATLILLFTKAVWAMVNPTHVVPELNKWVPTLKNLMPQVVPSDARDPRVVRLLAGLGLVMDVDYYFDQ
ncbi:hypothetical protein ACHAPT_001446 [Fusarium lateritium]